MEAAAEDGTILNHFPQSLLLALLDPRHHLGLAAAVAVVGVDHLLLDHRRKIGTTLMATTEAMAIVIGKMKIQDGQAAACAVMAPIVTGEMRIQIAIHIPRDVVVVEREEEDEKEKDSTETGTSRRHLRMMLIEKSTCEPWKEPDLCIYTAWRQS